jgi:hypothetical protein
MRERARDVPPSCTRITPESVAVSRPQARADAVVLLSLQRSAGNGAVVRMLSRQVGGAAVGSAAPPLDVVLALGRFIRTLTLPGGRVIRASATETLSVEARQASGLPAIVMSDMSEAQQEAFTRLQPSQLASGTVIQEAIEGGGGTRYRIRVIYLNTAGVGLLDRHPPKASPEVRQDFPEGTAQTAAEYRGIVAAMAAGNHQVDIYIEHPGGLSKVRAGRQIVEGAPLPAELRPHLPPSFATASPAPPSGGGGGGTPAREPAPVTEPTTDAPTRAGATAVPRRGGEPSTAGAERAPVTTLRAPRLPAGADEGASARVRVRKVSKLAGGAASVAVRALPFITALWSLHSALQLTDDFQAGLQELQEANRSLRDAGVDKLPTTADLRRKHGFDSSEAADAHALAWLESEGERVLSAVQAGNASRALHDDLTQVDIGLLDAQVRAQALNELNAELEAYIDQLSDVALEVHARGLAAADFLAKIWKLMKDNENFPPLLETLLPVHQTTAAVGQRLSSIENALAAVLDAWFKGRWQIRAEWIRTANVFNSLQPRREEILRARGIDTRSERHRYIIWEDANTSDLLGPDWPTEYARFTSAGA